MSLGVLNNIAAIYAQNNLNQTQSSLNSTLNELSSGSRINSGADDAAGLAVVDGLQANTAALTQSSQNATDGIGLLQTADGALSQVTNLLNRAVTLATEAANGTLNANQVSSANQEYTNILSEIGNIGSTTNFNGNSVFSNTAKTVFVSDGTSSGASSFSEVVGALSASSVGISAPSTTAGTSTALTNPTPTSSTTSAGATATFTLGAASDTISGTLSVTSAGVNSGNAVTSTFAAGTTLAQAAAQLNTQYGSNGLTASVNTTTHSLVITGPQDSSTAGTNDISLSGTSLSQTTAGTTTAAGAGVDFAAGASTDVSQLTAATAQTVLTSVTAAIGDVAYQRGVLGADINELSAASNVASAESENLTSAQDSIQSTNYGQATSDLAKYQVLSQTGISALAQANSVQQEVLKLLQ